MGNTIEAGTVTANGEARAPEMVDDNDVRTERNRERRLRRTARRLGFILNKRRGVANNWYGPNYWLLDGHTGNPVLHDNGDPRNRPTLEDVERHLQAR